MEQEYNQQLSQGCHGKVCDYVIDTTTGNPVCLSGSGTCLSADLLEADSSSFHGDNLVEATQKINQILTEIPEDADGRKLSFLVTKMGVFLGWVIHDGEVPENGVTAKDENETVAKALRLKNWEDR